MKIDHKSNYKKNGEFFFEVLTFSIPLPNYFLLFYNDFNQNKLSLDSQLS